MRNSSTYTLVLTYTGPSHAGNVAMGYSLGIGAGPVHVTLDCTCTIFPLMTEKAFEMIR